MQFITSWNAFDGVLVERFEGLPGEPLRQATPVAFSSSSQRATLTAEEPDSTKQPPRQGLAGADIAQATELWAQQQKQVSDMLQYKAPTKVTHSENGNYTTEPITRYVQARNCPAYTLWPLQGTKS